MYGVFTERSAVYQNSKTVHIVTDTNHLLNTCIFRSRRFVVGGILCLLVILYMWPSWLTFRSETVEQGNYDTYFHCDSWI